MIFSCRSTQYVNFFIKDLSFLHANIPAFVCGSYKKNGLYVISKPLLLLL